MPFNPDEFLSIKPTGFDPDSFLGEAPKEEPSIEESAARGFGQGATGGWLSKAVSGIASSIAPQLEGYKPGSKYEDIYGEILKDENLKNKLSEKANPKAYLASNLAGGVALSTVPGLNVSGVSSVPGVALRTGAQGAIEGAGYTDSNNPMEMLKNAVYGGGVGAITGAALQKLSNKLAPKFAENATGATGREQQLKFKEGSGQKLLDRGTVSWLDTPESIAKKAGKELEQSSKDIGGSLKAIPAPSKEAVVSNLNNEISKLDPVTDNIIISKLEKMADRIKSSPEAESAQQWWNRKIKLDKQTNWKMKLEKPQIAQANYLGSKAIRNSVERSAEATSPELAQKFSSDRNLYSLFAPIKDASEREAATLSQRKIGGMLDTLAATAGAGYGELTGKSHGESAGYGLGAAAGRRLIVPRLSSTIAKTLDSQALQRLLVGGAPTVKSGWEQLNQGQ